MELNATQSGKFFPIKLDHAGRFVVPVDSKIRQAYREGSALMAVESENGDFLIRRYEDVVKDVQALFTSRKPPQTSIVQQLLDDREIEAANE